MNGLVSIAVPVYNVENYLDRCVESLVNQTYKNIEIILIDDGSKDKSPQICDNWAKRDSRISVVHKENEGQGVARTLGIELAKGEYITFVDSDDYIDLTLVEKCVKSAVYNKTDVVVFGRKEISVDGVASYKGVTDEEEVFRGESVKTEFLSGLLIYKRGFGITSCRLYRVDMLKKYGMCFRSEREYVSEDTRFSLELFSKDISVSTVPQGLYFYCDRPESFSRVYSENRQERNDLFLQKNSEYAESVGLPQKVISHLKVRYHMFTLAVIKQIYTSQLTKKEKKKNLRKIFENKTLRSTLSIDVLLLEKPALRLFFCFVKLRLYFLCSLLLKIKMSK